MKTVVLVRHGKASWSRPELDDMDRPLKHRGKKNSEVMAERFSELGIHVHAVISSPALRAQTTAKSFGDRLVLPVECDDRLYNADISDLMDVVQGAADYQTTILLVGHNPGLSDFLRCLTGKNYPDLPAAGVAVVDFSVPEWSDIIEGGGTLSYSLSPKVQGDQVLRAA